MLETNEIEGVLVQEQEENMDNSFTKQCWYVWSEGFRYAYKEYSNTAEAIKTANECVEAFVKTFSEE